MANKKCQTVGDALTTKFVLKYKALCFDLEKFVKKGSHDFKRNSIIGIIYGFMRHLSIPLSCFNFFRTPYITKQREYAFR